MSDWQSLSLVTLKPANFWTSIWTQRRVVCKVVSFGVVGLSLCLCVCVRDRYYPLLFPSLSQPHEPKQQAPNSLSLSLSSIKSAPFSQL